MRISWFSWIFEILTNFDQFCSKLSALGYEDDLDPSCFHILNWSFWVEMTKLTILSKSLILLIFDNFEWFWCFGDVANSTELSTKVGRLWWKWDFHENREILQILWFLIKIVQNCQLLDDGVIWIPVVFIY